MLKKKGLDLMRNLLLNPTQEEKDKLKKVHERIKNEAFESSFEMSEDPGSQRNGGSLGYVTDTI